MILLRKIYTAHVSPRGTYSFSLTASCYALGWDYDGTRAYVPFCSEGTYGCAVAWDDGDIHIDIYLERPNDEALEMGIKTAIWSLGLAENLDEYYSLIAKDRLLGIICKRLRGIHMRAVASLWEGLLVGICQQNASFRQGWLMVKRLREVLGEELILEDIGRTIRTLPSPQAIIRKANTLRTAGVGYREKTILSAAKAFTTSDYETLEEIRGIGQYTARLARILALRKYDEFPVDRWFSRLIPWVYESEDVSWDRAKVENYTRKLWGPWRGLSAVMLTIVTAAEPIGPLLRALSSRTVNPMPDKPSPLTMWRYL